MWDDKPAPHDDPEALARGDLSGLSRREFIKLSMALIALTGTGACERRAETEDLRVLRILRAEDLLALRFEFTNLRVLYNRNEPARLVRSRSGEDGFLTVSFPGQHILEQAYPETATSVDIPTQSRLAPRSRLVFRMPADREYIGLSIDSLLDWQAWTPVFPGPNDGTPLPGQTAIELPYGLVLSPAETARWNHSTQPVTHGGRTELWHTRLTSGDPSQPMAVTILPAADQLGELDGVETSLNPDQRGQLTGMTAQETRTLMLSPIGGWLEVQGRWEEDSPIARWHHRATAGQDQRVVVQNKDGFLFPFGQRAARITVTERKLDSGTGSALLRKRTFVVIKVPEARYEHGRMALETLTAVDLVTPALDEKESPAGPFWIETVTGEPFLFRFRGKDWAGRDVNLEAPAIFVTEDDDLIARAGDLYRANESRRTCVMRGQPVAVVKFESLDFPDTDRWGKSLRKLRNTGDADPRTMGDTTLQLLKIRFAGGKVREAGADTPPFTCRTESMKARVPSLDPYLSDDRNRGWFKLDDPEDELNKGEVFAVATGEPIPLYFDKQADRCGGVASPSFDVAGLSRVRGPVADLGPMYGGELDPGKYFNAPGARLLGYFPLANLLRKPETEKSPWVPSFYCSLGCKQPDEYAIEGAMPPWEANLGLKWEIPLHEAKSGIFSFVPEKDCEGQTQSHLFLDASLSKVFKQCGSGKPATEKKTEANALGWSASGKITNFALDVSVEKLGGLSIGFDHLEVDLSPNRVKKKEGKDDKHEGGVEIDFKITRIHACGALGFFVVLMQPLMRIPALMSSLLPDDKISSTYPAKLPDVDDADVSVTLGPLQAPEQEFLKCKASNIAASVGVGLSFFPRSNATTNKLEVPPPLFTFRLSSPEEPLTLMAGQWGGICHVGVNISDGLTGIQASLGLVREFDIYLGVSKAECKGSLSVVYTFVREDDLKQLDLVLQLSGKTTISGIVEINLNIVAAGSWQLEDNLWYVSASISVSVRISFFAVKMTFAMSYRIAGEEEKTTAFQAAPSLERLTEDAWIAHRAAFAQGV